jgi:Fur family ferric uptake transcriptional regulator
MQQTPLQTLKSYLLAHGLKASRQREVIAEVFFAAGGHLRVDELLERVRSIDPRISQATVYRTMKLLTECGLAAARNFLDGQTRYEKSDESGEHHDHLICLRCDTIVEFVDERIEQLQDHVAKAHGFVVSDHKMELYGLCATCRAADTSLIP